MIKYLVTGGAGFIGSNLVERLLELGHFVRVLDNFSSGKRDNIAPFLSSSHFELIEGDLRDYTSVNKASAGIDFILHQGAIPSVRRSILDPITTNEVNVLGTLNVLEAARENKVKRLINASSSSVYGNNPSLPKQEAMATDPLSPYAVSKYAAERYCQVFYQLYGLETVSLRYFNVFGPRQDQDSQYSAVIAKFIRMIRKGEPPVIFGDGMQSRDFTYVENNVDAILLACQAKGVAGKVYNIACGKRYTLLDLVDYINKIYGTQISPVYEATQPGDIKHSLADITKAKVDLGFEVGIDFYEGLRKTILNYSS